MNKPPNSAFLWLWLWMHLFLCFTYSSARCPEKCLCKNNTDTTWSLRVKCGGTNEDQLSNWQNLDFEEDAVNVFILYVE